MRQGVGLPESLEAQHPQMYCQMFVHYKMVLTAVNSPYVSSSKRQHSSEACYETNQVPHSHFRRSHRHLKDIEAGSVPGTCCIILENMPASLEFPQRSPLLIH